jgi:hypothetical protein
MKTRTLSIGAGVALAATALVSPAPAAATQGDCDVKRPQAEMPGSTTEAPPNEATGDSLTEKLATCGSVLNPPPVGDIDIVEPTPPVGDDINIHPDAPAARP